MLGLHRIMALLVAAFFLGCSDARPNAPLLKLTVQRDNGTSVGSYRVSHTGLIAGSGERSGDGAATGQSLTIDKIADDGVTLTITVSDPDSGDSSQQIQVPYDEEVTVAVSEEVTVIARLERQE